MGFTKKIIIIIMQGKCVLIKYHTTKQFKGNIFPPIDLGVKCDQEYVFDSPVRHRQRVQSCNRVTL